MCIKPGEVVIEAGGYDGKTADQLSRKYGVQVHTFEPVGENFLRLKQQVDGNALVVPNNMALSNTSKALKITSDAACSFVNESLGISTNCMATSIDEYVASYSLRVSHIKLDVEGHEIEALEGALVTLATQRPSLAVAIYHKPQDPILIPEYLISKLENYRFYIGMHSQWILESMIYCIPEPL